MEGIEVDPIVFRDTIVEHLINEIDRNINKSFLVKDQQVDAGPMLLSSIISDLNDLHANAKRDNPLMATLAIAMKKIVILMYLSAGGNDNEAVYNKTDNQVEDLTLQMGGLVG